MLKGAKGLVGELRAGGRVAARITEWEMERLENGAGWHIAATLADTVEPWLPRVTEMRLELGRRTWRWREIAPEFVASRVHVRGIAAPEEFVS